MALTDTKLEVILEVIEEAVRLKDFEMAERLLRWMGYSVVQEPAAPNRFAVVDRNELKSSLEAAIVDRVQLLKREARDAELADSNTTQTPDP